MGVQMKDRQVFGWPSHATQSPREGMGLSTFLTEGAGGEAIQKILRLVSNILPTRQWAP